MNKKSFIRLTPIDGWADTASATIYSYLKLTFIFRIEKR